MGSYPLAEMYIFVYNAIYKPDAITGAMNTLNEAINVVSENNVVASIKLVLYAVALGLVGLAFITELLDKVSAGDFSIQILFREILKYIFPAVLLYYAPDIFRNLLNMANAATMAATTGLNTADLSADTLATTIAWNPNTFGMLRRIIYSIDIIIPYLFALVFKIMIAFILSSRLIELNLRFIGAPLVFAGSFYGKGTSSDLVRFYKRTFSLMFQLAVITIIWQTMLICRSLIINYSNGASNEKMLQDIKNGDYTSALAVNDSVSTHQVWAINPETGIDPNDLLMKYMLDHPISSYKSSEEAQKDYNEYKWSLVQKSQTYSVDFVEKFMDTISGYGSLQGTVSSLIFMFVGIKMVTKSRQISDSIFL